MIVVVKRRCHGWALHDIAWASPSLQTNPPPPHPTPPNSSAAVRNASTYRTHLERALPLCFEALHATLRSPTLGRFSALHLEEKVLQVLRTWEGWSIYPPLFLTGLEATFRRKPGDLDAEPEPAAEEELAKERDALLRQARQAGLPITALPAHGQGQGAARPEALPLQEVARRVTHLDRYIKLRAAGKTEAPAGALGGRAGGRERERENLSRYGPSVVAMPQEEEDDDEDVDGVPLDAVAGRTGGSRALRLVAASDSDDSDVDGRPLDPDPAPAGKKRPRANSAFSTSDSSSDEDDDWGRRRRQQQQQQQQQEEEKPEEDGSRNAVTWTPEEEAARRTMLRQCETSLLLLRDELEAEGTPAEEIEKQVQARRVAAVGAWEAKALAKRAGAAPVGVAVVAVQKGPSSSTASRRRSRSRSRSGDKERKRRRSRSRSKSRERRRSRSRSREKARR
jgi:hypothetical protein